MLSWTWCLISATIINSVENVTVAPYNLSLVGRHGQGSRKVSIESVQSVVRPSEAKRTVKNGIRKEKKKRRRENELKRRYMNTAILLLKIQFLVSGTASPPGASLFKIHTYNMTGLKDVRVER